MWREKETHEEARRVIEREGGRRQRDDGRRSVRKGEKERGRRRREKRGARRASGRLNDDSEVDGFLGPFYIESQRSA